jgi:hypothetical protein
MIRPANIAFDSDLELGNQAVVMEFSQVSVSPAAAQVRSKSTLHKTRKEAGDIESYH